MLNSVDSPKLSDKIEAEIFKAFNKYKFEKWCEYTKTALTYTVLDILRKYNLSSKIRFDLRFDYITNTIWVDFPKDSDNCSIELLNWGDLYET